MRDPLRNPTGFVELRLRYHLTHQRMNDIARIVTPFERIGRGDGNVSYQIQILVFAAIPFSAMNSSMPR